jgi:hypothetical protein
MKPFSFFLLLLMLSQPLFARDAISLSPKAIIENIEHNGAKAVVDKLASGKHPRQWEKVLQKIETGNSHWLAVAKALSEGTDAGTSTDMIVTLARALPRNPSGVLLLVDGKPDAKTYFSIEELCSAPFIEPEDAYLNRYLIQTQLSLKKLHNRKVEMRRKECLARIEQVVDYIKQQNNNK